MSRASAHTLPSVIWTEESGQSNDSTLLRTVLRRVQEHATEPVSLGWKGQLYDLAMEIGTECSVAGWDGYGGAPISTESVIKTLKLIAQLPESTPPPDLVPSPEGHIAFEWHDSKKRVLSVSPKKDLLIWASILAPDDTRFGRSPERRGWPRPVLDILNDYFGHE